MTREEMTPFDKGSYARSELEKKSDCPSHPRAGEERWTIRKRTGEWDDVIEGPDVDEVEVMPVPSDHQPARLGPEPKVKASSKESFVVALEREELEAIEKMMSGLHSDWTTEQITALGNGRSKLRAALSEPRGGA